MEEMIKEEASGQPNPEENTFSQGEEDTTPNTPDNNAFLEVKFNKETKRLTIEEATTLAQKGMKLDQISEELGILQSLAKEKGVGLKDFVHALKNEREKTRLELLKERYSDDTELAEILSGVEADEVRELKELIPEIREELIPQEVKRAAEQNGKGLLLEYLLYEFKRNKAQQNETARQEASRAQSLGSLSSGGAENTADAEFLRGLWG